MRYIYERGRLTKTRVMHIGLHDPITGEVLFEPLCGESRLRFNTSINAPWSLGLGVCKKCEAKLGHGGRNTEVTDGDA